jgi:DNA (cytosine-5)-methyltransferase 1
LKIFPVIDLFAGPGGLGEGFSALYNGQNRLFKIKLSIEKDTYAYQTLELRAFFRWFEPGKAPDDYYDYLSGQITRSELFNRHREAARCAREEAWLAELGESRIPEQLVDDKIGRALGSQKQWVLIGGPPCQAYSIVGRSRVIGGEGLAKYEADPKHKLYRHYLRILAVHQPPVFVMENVKGLISAKLKNENTFERIITDLEHPLQAMPSIRRIVLNHNLEYRLFPLVQHNHDLLGRYRPEDFVIQSEEHGVPQARHRVIILGIRSDLDIKPFELAFLPKTTIDQAIGELPRLRSGLSKENDSPEAWRNAILEITKAHWFQNGSIKNELRKAMLQALQHLGANLNRGQRFIKKNSNPAIYVDWFHDNRLEGICNHETRCHIPADLHRYLFAAVYASMYKRSPLLEDLPKALLPDHRNVTGPLKDIMFNDRFRVQLAGRPSTTVVSHIAKDGHYYIHYDPTQCRCLTVREAARLQTFPDNYFFEGPRTAQYKQVGNAVPPLLARQIAKIVVNLLT